MKAWRDERGAVLVEFAIIAPIMVLMAVGILDVGTAILQSMSLAFVTQGAAKAESQSPGTGVAGGELPAPGGVVHREHSSLRRTESGRGPFRWSSSRSVRSAL